MRQQLCDLTGPLRRQSLQHILEIGMRIMPVHARRLDQTHDGRSPPPAYRCAAIQEITSLSARVPFWSASGPPAHLDRKVDKEMIAACCGCDH